MLYCANGNRLFFSAGSVQKTGYTNEASLIGCAGVWLGEDWLVAK